MSVTRGRYAAPFESPWWSTSRVVPFPTYTLHWQVYQGGLTNRYLVHALQALSLRPPLVHELFGQSVPGNSSIEAGVFVVTLYKNGQYIPTEIDDLFPCDANGHVLSCFSEDFPYILWPSLVEKAFAKLHCAGREESSGWEIVGEGGSVEEMLVDLTGGVGGRWYTKDVSPDRLFVYIHELQREALFCCSVDERQCDIRGIFF